MNSRTRLVIRKRRNQRKIEALKKAIESDVLENMEKAKKELMDAFSPLAQKIYAQAQANAQAQGDGGAGAVLRIQVHQMHSDDGVVDADYEVVDE